MNILDRKIISELYKDARVPFFRIAKKLGISHETVRQRYAKMIKEGTIQQFSIGVDLSKIGGHGTVFLTIKSSQNQRKSEIVKKLSKMRNIVTTVETIGNYDILSIAKVKDLKSLNELIKNIQLSGAEAVDFSLSTEEAHMHQPWISPLLEDEIESRLSRE